jgi:hypothetical protein
LNKGLGDPVSILSHYGIPQIRTMLDTYSLLLALALGAAALSWVFLVLSHWRPTVRPATTVSAAIAVLFDAASLTTHHLLGHVPGTPDAMPPTQFLAEHPAFLGVFLASAVAFVLVARATRHERRVA